MEAQDLRITRLEDIMETAVTNQTHILRMLQEQSQRLDTVVERLDEHTTILEDHSMRLENLENLMTRVLEELVAIKEILASSRAIGFAPEPEAGD